MLLSPCTDCHDLRSIEWWDNEHMVYVRDPCTKCSTMKTGNQLQRLNQALDKIGKQWKLRIKEREIP